MNFRKINENALTFRILWEIEKLTEADEVFTSSDAQLIKEQSTLGFVTWQMKVCSILII